MQVQTPTFELFYGKSQITHHIKPSLLSLTYTDHLSDQSDELQVTFEDSERKWITTTSSGMSAIRLPFVTVAYGVSKLM